jgi:hypothetical protein
MPTYGVGSNLALVVEGTENEVEIVSRRVEDVVVVVVTVMAPNANLDRKCQFDRRGCARSRAMRTSHEVKTKHRMKRRTPTVRLSGLKLEQRTTPARPNRQEEAMRYVRVPEASLYTFSHLLEILSNRPTICL